MGIATLRASARNQSVALLVSRRRRSCGSLAAASSLLAADTGERDDDHRAQPGAARRGVEQPHRIRHHARGQHQCVRHAHLAIQARRS